MMRKLCFMLVMLFGLSDAQVRDFLDASDKSDRSVQKHHGLISRNQEIVNYIEYTFDQNGVPRHLRNLALIESHFNNGAQSWVGALGIWQFMTGHASDYGLSSEDRQDIYKSTKIAARSLRNLYRRYGNWITVIAAYNCGEGNVNKAMRRAGSKDYGRFYQFLPNESINHVKKYLNACYATGELAEVQADYARFAGYPLKSEPKPELKTADPRPEETIVKAEVKPAEKQTLAQALSKQKPAKSSNGKLTETDINGGYDLAIIAEYLKIDVKKLLSWNPGIKRKLDTKGEAQLFLPYDLMVVFNINKNAILNESLKVIRDKDKVQALN